jgi:hypothetical protein
MVCDVIKTGKNVYLIPSKMNECDAKRLCDPMPEFDTIEKCKLCGRML